MAQMVTNLPAMQETWVRSLGCKIPPEKRMATHSSILAWRIAWTGEPGGLQSVGLQKVGHNWATNMYIHAYLSIYLYQPIQPVFSFLGGVFFFFIAVYLLYKCCVSFCCAAKSTRYPFTLSPLFFVFPSHLVHHRALSSVPCAIK